MCNDFVCVRWTGSCTVVLYVGMRQLKESLELDRLCAGRQWTLYLCSREQPESAREGMEWISHQLRPVGVDGATCEHHHLNQTANDTTQFNAI
jgi:hypothetical protein